MLESSQPVKQMQNRIGIGVLILCAAMSQGCQPSLNSNAQDTSQETPATADRAVAISEASPLPIATPTVSSSTPPPIASSATSPTPQSSPDTYTIRNGEWTITIGNTQAWSGVNRTGNATYEGCDAQQRCLKLTGGKTTCRDGFCWTVWTNGDYTYTVQSPIRETVDPQAPGTKLIVQKGGKVILEATGFKS